jgi:hypothetical protein
MLPPTYADSCGCILKRINYNIDLIYTIFFMALRKSRSTRSRKTKHSRRLRQTLKQNYLSRNKRNTQLNKKRKRANKKSRSQKKRRTLKGGAIPFSEYGLAYDNARYGVQSIQNVFSDDSPTVINNANQPVNPNPTAQFNRTRAIDSNVKGPNLGGLFSSSYSS